MHRLLSIVVSGVVAASVCLSAETPASSQTTNPASPPPTAALIGTVVDDGTGKPIAGALVTLFPAPGSPAALASSASRVPAPQVLTGEDGRFMFTALAAGPFTLSARRGGYLNAAAGSSIGGTGMTVFVAEGQTRAGLTIEMARPATVSGVVLDEAGDPVIGATVQVARRTLARGRASWSAVGANSSTTDDRGMYRVASLTPGDYVVFVSQSLANLPTSMVEAYQEAQNKTPRGQTNPLSAEMFATGAFGNMPGSTNGRLVGTQIEQLQQSTLNTVTDANGHTFVYPLQFYPAASTPSTATVLQLRSGDDRSGIDLALRPVPAIKVSGTVTGPDGPAAFTAVLLAPKDEVQTFQAPGRVGTTTDATGAFTLLTVPTGEYVLRVTRIPPVQTTNNMVMQTITNADGSVTSMGSSSGPSRVVSLPPDPTLWAEMPVSAGSKDITNLNISLQQGARLAGRVVFSGTTAQPEPSAVGALNFSLQPLGEQSSSRAPRTLIDEQGKLTTQGYPAGQYTANVSGLPTGWALESIKARGVDIWQVPLDLGSTDIPDVVITLTDKPSDLSGTVTDRQGAPSAAAVFLMPADEPLVHPWGLNPRRVLGIRAGDTGAYTFRNIPPGEYRVIAIDDVSMLNEYTPAFVQSLVARATLVRIAKGDKHQQSLQVVTVK